MSLNHLPLNNVSINKKQKGFSLIEVMVSLVVLSLGILALTNLQTRSVSNSTVAYAETQSMLLLQEMVEHLRIDKVAAVAGNYDIALSAFSDLTAVTGTDPLSERARYTWFNNLNRTVPGAKASITCDNISLCVVEVEHGVSGSPQKKSLAIIL